MNEMFLETVERMDSRINKNEIDITSICKELKELRAFKEKACSVINKMYADLQAQKKLVEALKSSGVGNSTRKPFKAITDPLKCEIEGIFKSYGKYARRDMTIDGNFMTISVDPAQGEWVATEKQIAFLSKLVSKRSNLKNISKIDAKVLIDAMKQTKLEKPQVTVVVEKKQ